MLIRKCDLCKKKIAKEPITAAVGFFNRRELCDKCGAPIVKFLKKYKLINPGEVKNKIDGK